MPSGYKVEGNDAYVCTTLQLPSKAYKLVGVVPKARQEVVHHILLFGELAFTEESRGVARGPRNFFKKCSVEKLETSVDRKFRIDTRDRDEKNR